MKPKNEVQKLFIKEKTNQGEKFVLNSKLKLEFENDQERVQYLLEVIKFWYGKCTIFCRERNPLKASLGDELLFGYQKFSTCDKCVNAQKLLDKIFGSHDKFNNLPFVTSRDDRWYEFSFDLLEYFAKNGYHETAQLIQEKTNPRNWEKSFFSWSTKRSEAERLNEKLEKIGKMDISKKLWDKLLPYAYGEFIFVEPDIIIIVFRSKYESLKRISKNTAELVYYNSVYMVAVAYGDEVKDSSWSCTKRVWETTHEYRDGAEGRFINVPDFSKMVDDIGTIEVFREINKVKVEVELINKEYGNRKIIFEFPSKTIALNLLSQHEQEAFIKKVRKEMDRVESELLEKWGNNSKISKPRIRQIEIYPEIGIAAFVTEEHNGKRENPQIKNKLFVLMAGNEKAELKYENEREGEGNPSITITDIKKVVSEVEKYVEIDINGKREKIVLG